MRALNQPNSWWGWHGWNHPEPLSITRIVRAGTLTPELAALFWLGMERGASFVFAADPPGAGKTTLLTALLPFACPDASAYFTRGWGETFDLPPRHEGPAPAFIMVNEISDHLPVYSWGPYVVRIFELMAEGYSLLTTMHADECEEVVAQLEEDNGVPPTGIARLTFIVPLSVGYGREGTRRRVAEVGLVGPDGENGYALRGIARWDSVADAFHVLEGEGDREAVAGRLGLAAGEFETELTARAEYVAALVRDGVHGMQDVAERIEARYRAGARRGDR